MKYIIIPFVLYALFGCAKWLYRIFQNDPLAWPILVTVSVVSCGVGWCLYATLMYRHWCKRNDREGE